MCCVDQLKPQPIAALPLILWRPAAYGPLQTLTNNKNLMTESRIIPWKRIAVEAVAIVASILFAFAIDAWWDDRQQQEAEQVILQTLLDDLRIKQTLLADMNRFNEAIVESTDTLLRVATGTEEKLSEEDIDRLIIDTWWVNNEALWDSAPLNLLVAGGNLSLVSDPTLVQALAALQVAIGRVRHHYRNDGAFYNDVMTPFMIANANMTQINASVTHRPGHPEKTVTVPDYGLTVSHRHSELLSTMQFQNLLIAKRERCADILDIGHPGVEKHLAPVIRMLEDELDQ